VVAERRAKPVFLQAGTPGADVTDAATARAAAFVPGGCAAAKLPDDIGACCGSRWPCLKHLPFADRLMEIVRGADSRAEKRDPGQLRPAWDRHRFARGAGRAADQADRRPDRAPEGAQARPPLAARTAAAGRTPAPAAQVRRADRCRAISRAEVARVE